MNYKLFLIWTTRILFGIANSSVSNPLLNEPQNFTLHTPEQRQTIETLCASDSSFNNVFSPINELYYDGPMGNYGAHLKARFAGYQIINAEGLRFALHLREMNIPVIDTPNTFEQFIKKTPMMSRSIAIVEHLPVMCSSKIEATMDYNDRGDDPIFYTVVYEKRNHSDALYVYHSSAITIDMEQIKNYFAPKFFLFTPDQIRTSAELSSLYAIQDAKYLLSHMKIEINTPLLMKLKLYLFRLDDSFIYNKNSLMQDHTDAIIDAAQNLTVHPSQPT